MKSREKSSIWKDLKGVLRVTSLSKLQQKGKKSVRVIGMDQILQLIEKAVDRALDERMLEMETRERGRIVSEARQEFERLSREVTQLETSRRAVFEEVRDAEQRVDALRLEIQHSEALMAEVQNERRLGEFLPAEPGIDRTAWAREIGDIIQDSLDEVGPLSDEARERLVRRLAAAMPDSPERLAPSSASDFEYREKITTLERRMAKLRRRLAEAEKILESAQGGEVDPGIASIYREVQGLGDGSRNLEKKKGLMSVIYEANRKLQKDTA